MKQPPLKQAVSCEDCGVPMVVDDIDPMPGACVACGARRLLRLATRMQADIDRAQTPEEALTTQYARLLDVGYRPAAASLQMRRVAAELGLPAPRAALATANLAWDRKVAAARAEWARADAEDDRP